MIVYPADKSDDLLNYLWKHNDINIRSSIRIYGYVVRIGHIDIRFYSQSSPC